jgi:tetratricopeptide (TPR) repeat protein
MLGFDVRRSSTGPLSSTTSSSSSEQQQQQQNTGTTSSKTKHRSSTTIVLPSSLRQMSYKWDSTIAATAGTTTNKGTSTETSADRGNMMEAMTVVQLKAELAKYGLAKSGSKAVLQERLRNHIEVTTTPPPLPFSKHVPAVDIFAILQRRKEIHKQKSQPYHAKPKHNTSKILDTTLARQVLQKIYQKPSSSLETNQHATKVYQAAKEADQVGDTDTAKYLLRSLDSSHDARILRRLARLEHEDGNTELAKTILHDGLSTHHQNNPYLWHGLAAMEDTMDAKRQCYQNAIQADPNIPHSYHALATLEHTNGHIKAALEVLKTGLKYCPTNHRLHHALGDLYRDAKVLKRATASYHKALEYGPTISHGYALTALAFCAYDDNNMELCRDYLQQAIQHNPRQANACMSLAQFEESLGNVDVARNVCRTAIAQYELELLKKYSTKSSKNDGNDVARTSSDPIAYKNDLLRNVPRKRSGDKFIHVYRTWMRMERRYGTVESFEEVFQQASAAFTDVRIQLDAAHYYASRGLNEIARKHFMDACKSSSRSVDAFRIFGMHEMKLGNYALAERIFYTGAMTGRAYGLAELLYAWAVCEWRTDQHQNAASLFQCAIEESGDDVRLRSFILYVSARFEFKRGEYHRAQHFVGRCLSVNPNHMPGGNEQVWTLWKKIAEAMGDERLAHHCHNQAWKSVLDENEATRVQQGDLQQQIRRDPWISKVFSLDPEGDSVYNLNILPNDDISLFEKILLSDEALVKS